MIKGKEILGRGIVALSTGAKIDAVRDVVFDHEGNQVLAFLVDEGGWFRAAKAVPFECVRSIGEDAVMIGSPDDVTSSRDNKRLGDALESKTSLIGMALLTTDGQNLGRISDVYFDENTGRVVGYEATGGLFADLSSGRAYIPAPNDVQIGTDAAIVPTSVAAAMKENPGGIRGAIKAVTGGVSGAVQNASESVREGVQSASESVKGAVENVSEAATERQQQYVVGKVSNTELVADDGTVIVKKGETITPLHAEVAEWHKMLPALTAAATGGVIAAAVGSAADSVKDTYEDVKDAAADKQKAYVVGKVAGRNVMADDGEVIVAGGVTITAHQADRAEQVGKLAALTAAATVGAVGDSVQETRERVNAAMSDDATEAHVPDTVQDTVGRRIQTDVRVPGGSLLAVQGQIVTPDIVARAESLGLQQELIAATRGESTAQHAQDAVAGAGAALADGVASVGEGASHLFNRAKDWLNEKREETEAAIEEREAEYRQERIREALGRPVTRVILAPDDTVILNVGEVVTHKAVQDAQDGDVLDLLLDSVSREVPAIDPLASRPAETGQAALDSQGDPHKPS